MSLRYRDLDDSPLPALALDAEWRIVYANGPAAALLGDAPRTGTPLWAIAPEAEGSIFGDALRRARTERIVTTARADYPPFGSHFAIVAVPVGDDLLVQATDLGHADRTASALVDTARRLARAEEIALLGNWSWEIATGVVEWSDGLYALLGLERSFIPSFARLAEVIHPDDLGRNEAALTETIRSGVPYRLTLRMRGATGGWRVMEVRGETIHDADGGAVRMFGTVQDITASQEAEAARRRLELQMQHAQKLESLGVLAGGIAHDFNNLLVGMLGNASLALLDTPPASPARGPIEDIERAAQRAAELTRQLLAYSGKGRFVIEPVDVSRLVEEMTSLLRAALSKKAELVLDLPRALPAIDADATQLRQVVMNLLTNASDAIGDEVGTIAIRTGVQRVEATYRATLLNGDAVADGDYVFVDVADTGIGMDGATIARIFDPFFTTKFTGRGLGLAATLGIVRGHRGAIKVYSEPGRGTTFRLLFPASRDLPSEPPAPQAAVDFPRGTTVLVVDDEAAVRAVARAMLERRGFRVLLAEDGEQAVTHFAQAAGAIDVVLLDLTMPRLDGEQTFRALRTIAPGVRVVLMSGYNQQDVTNQFVGKGLAGFIQKPFRASELYEAIARVVRDTGAP